MTATNGHTSVRGIYLSQKCKFIRGKSLRVCLCAAFALATAGLMRAQELPLHPLEQAGDSITGALEGWFQNPDGTYSILLGYFNRNMKEVVDIPVGPDNHIDPGGPDRGQPTHFLPRRQWGLFTITVPKDFGDRKLTWTIVANGKSMVIPASLNPLWEVSPYKEDSMGNTPPFISFKPDGLSHQGPIPLVESLTTTVGAPLTLDVWGGDDAKTLPGTRRPPPKTPALTVSWSKYRGPGEVTFGNAKPKIETGVCKPGTTSKVCGKASTTATFSAPGKYELYVVLNDWSGEGGRGFQCCWTNGHVSVTVNPDK